MKIDKVYVITLNHTEEYQNSRIETINSLFDSDTPIEIEFVPGIHFIDSNECVEYLKNNKYSVYKYWKIEYSDNKWWNRELKIGEIGCFLSHYKIWKIAYENKYENIIIFEEDFFIPKSTNKKIKEKINKFEMSYDILYLGRNKVGDDLAVIDEEKVFAGYSYNNHAYAINRLGLKKILAQNPLENIIPVDEFISAITISHPREDIRNLYINNCIGISFTKDLIVQKNEHSNIENSDFIIEKNNINKKITNGVVKKIFIVDNTNTNREDVDLIFNDIIYTLGKIIDYNLQYETFYSEKYLKEELSNFNDIGLVLYVEKYVDYTDKYLLEIFNRVENYKMWNNSTKSFMMYHSGDVTKVDPSTIQSSLNIIEGNDMNTYDILDITNINTWCDKYLSNAIKTKKWDLVVRDLGDELYTIPVFNKDFCDALIKLANDRNKWTKDRHAFYPTTDVLLSVLDEKVEHIYNYVLDNYIIPMANHIWQTEGKDWSNMKRENFMIKYELDGQSHLDLHHDYADYTALLTLNTEFTGGGTYFNRQKRLVKSDVAGTITLHPATLTHKHGAMPIESGERYVVVSFIRRN